MAPLQLDHGLGPRAATVGAGKQGGGKHQAAPPIRPERWSGLLVCYLQNVE